MKISCFLMSTVFLATMCFGLTTVSAQNMSHTVVTKEVKFAKGRSSATVRGIAKYAMSYVFMIGAKRGQTIDLNLAGKNPKLTFSFMAPEDGKMPDTWGAFGVAKWSGELPESGKYTLVVVMNDAQGGSVPFTLGVKIK